MPNYQTTAHADASNPGDSRNLARLELMRSGLQLVDRAIEQVREINPELALNMLVESLQARAQLNDPVIKKQTIVTAQDLLFALSKIPDTLALDKLIQGLNRIGEAGDLDRTLMALDALSGAGRERFGRDAGQWTTKIFQQLYAVGLTSAAERYFEHIWNGLVNDEPLRLNLIQRFGFNIPTIDRLIDNDASIDLGLLLRNRLRWLTLNPTPALGMEVKELWERKLVPAQRKSQELVVLLGEISRLYTLAMESLAAPFVCLGPFLARALILDLSNNHPNAIANRDTLALDHDLSLAHLPRLFLRLERDSCTAPALSLKGWTGYGHPWFSWTRGIQALIALVPQVALTSVPHAKKNQSGWIIELITDVCMARKRSAAGPAVDDRIVIRFWRTLAHAYIAKNSDHGGLIREIKRRFSAYKLGTPSDVFELGNTATVNSEQMINNGVATINFDTLADFEIGGRFVEEGLRRWQLFEGHLKQRESDAALSMLRCTIERGNCDPAVVKQFAKEWFSAANRPDLQILNLLIDSGIVDRDNSIIDELCQIIYELEGSEPTTSKAINPDIREEQSGHSMCAVVRTLMRGNRTELALKICESHGIKDKDGYHLLLLTALAHAQNAESTKMLEELVSQELPTLFSDDELAEHQLSYLPAQDQGAFAIKYGYRRAMIVFGDQKLPQGIARYRNDQVALQIIRDELLPKVTVRIDQLCCSAHPATDREAWLKAVKQITTYVTALGVAQ